MWERDLLAPSITRFTPLQLLLASAPRVSALISSEMGKPHAQALGEVRGCAARVAAQVADAPAALSPRVAFASAQLEERVEYEPIGVVANIGAWNYPLFTAANVFGAALLGGASRRRERDEATTIVSPLANVAETSAGGCRQRRVVQTL